VHSDTLAFVEEAVDDEDIGGKELVELAERV
jgi:hypothetical protein